MIKTILTVSLALSVLSCNSPGSEQKSMFNPYKSDETGKSVTDCSSLEPENPYDQGSGHFAGYEWASAKNATSCGGNSPSFIEGCNTYISQEEDYARCLHH